MNEKDTILSLFSCKKEANVVQNFNLTYILSHYFNKNNRQEFIESTYEYILFEIRLFVFRESVQEY